ncbi:hypothetical protein OF83DRAFT_57891 [Amylostereum chailletii]|nr:hypothetical protein OF83DRAFT_57891 [Amylostereum chailletii]
MHGSPLHVSSSSVVQTEMKSSPRAGPTASNAWRGSRYQFQHGTTTRPVNSPSLQPVPALHRPRPETPQARSTALLLRP